MAYHVKTGSTGYGAFVLCYCQENTLVPKE